MTRKTFSVIHAAAVVTASAAGLLLFAPTMALAQTGDAALDAALAERLALIADDSVLAQETPEPLLRQSAAMLDVARLFAPNEIRFARSQVDVLLRLGEADRALAALGAVRTLDPKDQVAMIQFIDLSANKMETADAKLAYLRQVVDARAIPAEVRSHAAVSLMDLYFQRSQDRQAVDALQTAIELNPQNISALAMRYRLAAASGVALERIKAIAALAQAAPSDARNLLALARECVDVGDYENAGAFYSVGLGLYTARGQTPPIGDFIDFSGAMFLGGQTQGVQALTAQALEVVKDDGRLYALAMLVDQYNGVKLQEERAEKIAQARGVYLAQLAGVSQLLNNPEAKEMPATSPAVPMPDIAADVAKLTAGDPGNLRTAYTVALAEQIWFDLYFRAAPVEDTTINALGVLLGDNDPLVVRCQGWKMLAAGQADAARVKLGAVADRDAYAKLGLVAAALAESKPDEAKTTMRELLAARPAGLVAVYAAVAAKQLDVKAEMTPEELEVAQVAGALRRPVEEALGNPRSAYILSASPVNISLGWGDPLLVKLTLQNNSRTPVTIGPGAMIDPRYAFDVQMRGDQPRMFPATATGRWTGAVRLMPRQSISQVVRADRGTANLFLRQYPTPFMTLTVFVTSNPLFVQAGTVPGPGGQQTTAGNVIERRAAPLYVEAFRTKLTDQVSKGSPVERLNAIELINAVLPLLRNQSGNADAQTVASQLQAAVQAQLAAEPIAELKGWLTLSSTGATSMEEHAQFAQQAAASESMLGKVMALMTARVLPGEQRRAVAQAVLAQNPTGPVLELAQAVQVQEDLAAPSATTQPAGTAGTGGAGATTKP